MKLTKLLAALIAVSAFAPATDAQTIHARPTMGLDITYPAPATD